MRICLSILLAVVAIIVALGYRQYLHIITPGELPEFNLTTYWGRGVVDKHMDDVSKVLNEFHYQPEPIDELRRQLSRDLDLPAPLEGTNFEYGVNSEWLSEFVEYWRDDYLARWIVRELDFNQVPHYTTYIQGLRIHYVHTKATYETHNKTIIPLLLLHGWPGSMREFFNFTTIVAWPDNEDFDYVFEVVAPSLPGFGFSDAPAKPGFGIVEMSIVLRNLMQRLNYDRFYIQGGDWGSALGSAIATMFPENVIGYHSNACFAASPLFFVKQYIASWSPRHFLAKPEYESFHFPGSEKLTNLIAETGYFHIQATKPDTIGIALSMNPVGLAAYILEKFSTWTNPANRELRDGGWSTFSQDYKDVILDHIMIYYLTHSITTSVRLYSEAFSSQQAAHGLDKVPTLVPTGCARFRHDLVHALDWQLIDKYPNLVHSTYHNEGGHFIAMENPRLLFSDFAKFVKIVQKLTN